LIAFDWTAYQADKQLRILSALTLEMWQWG